MSSACLPRHPAVAYLCLVSYSNMAQSEKRGSWRGHVGWLAGQLIVVFAGVSAAFVVENYRDSKNQQAEFRQALSGVIAELNRYETRGLEFADGMDTKISAWEQADRKSVV